jgi:nicotinamidase-related amidase/quercetin dioxygenase-like cupin family protein
MLLLPADPFPFPLEPGATALVMIDMQRDFLEPGGFGAVLGNDVEILASAIAPARRLLGVFRSAGWPVIHTREGHAADLSDLPESKRVRGSGRPRIGEPGPLGRVLVRGEAGHGIVPDLAPVDDEIVIDKPGKGAFFATDLDHRLRSLGITCLVLAGVTTDVCVQTTMREANDRGYRCLLIDEATASYQPAFKTATLAMITAQSAIVGWVAAIDTFCAFAPLAKPSFPLSRAVLEAGAAAAAGATGLLWESLHAGVEIAPLVAGNGGATRVALLRYQPGAAVPAHRHPGWEHILVIAGSQADERGTYPAGSFISNPPGRSHRVRSDDGCLVLIAWQQPVVLQ